MHSGNAETSSDKVGKQRSIDPDFTMSPVPLRLQRTPLSREVVAHTDEELQSPRRYRVERRGEIGGNRSGVLGIAVAGCVSDMQDQIRDRIVVKRLERGRQRKLPRRLRPLPFERQVSPDNRKTSVCSASR